MVSATNMNKGSWKLAGAVVYNFGYTRQLIGGKSVRDLLSMVSISPDTKDNDLQQKKFNFYCETVSK